MDEDFIEIVKNESDAGDDSEENDIFCLSWLHTKNKSVSLLQAFLLLELFSSSIGWDRREMSFGIQCHPCPTIL